MPPRMFRNIGYVAIVAVATIGAMVYFSLTVLWPTIIGTIYTTDSMQIGWQSSVVGGGMLLGQTMAGFTISYVPKVKLQCIAASASALAFSASLTTISPDRWEATIALGILLVICEFQTTAHHCVLLCFPLILTFRSRWLHREHLFTGRHACLGATRHRPCNRRLGIHT